MSHMLKSTPWVVIGTTLAWAVLTYVFWPAPAQETGGLPGQSLSMKDLMELLPVVAGTVGLIVVGLQNMRIKWRQQAAVANVELAAAMAAAAKVAAETANATSIATAEMVSATKLAADKAAAEAALLNLSMSAKLDGVVVQLDGKLQARLEEVKAAAHAAGVLEEKTRRAGVESEIALVGQERADAKKKTPPED